MASSILCGAEKYCQRGKIHCDLHYNWEALALADVDLERFREVVYQEFIKYSYLLIIVQAKAIQKITRVLE